MSKWIGLGIGAKELGLEVSLMNGQAFGWKRIGEEVYAGVIGDSIVQLRQLNNEPASYLSDRDIHSELSDYLRLDVDLPQLYTKWSKDSKFKSIASSLPGVRLLRQSPSECLFSFICSSNNNIKRITSMLDNLRSRYGVSLGSLGTTEYFKFPTIERLSIVKEQELRDLGFGYRAKYITRTARQLHELGGEKYLLNLRQVKSRTKVREALIQFSGIGPKVADCIALFALDQLDVVPVDTHMWQIARRDYRKLMKSTSSKTLTSAAYEDVGNLFRGKFGSSAGWAHSVLFTADLPQFQDRLHIAPELEESPRKRVKAE